MSEKIGTCQKSSGLGPEIAGPDLVRAQYYFGKIGRNHIIIFIIL